jgi:hypothetical protein
MPVLFVAGAQSFLGTIANTKLEKIAENGTVFLTPAAGTILPQLAAPLPLCWLTHSEWPD